MGSEMCIRDRLCRVHLTAPVAAGDVVIPNVLGTGVDVVATRSV
mgnify:CR=1 FL=1